MNTDVFIYVIATNLFTLTMSTIFFITRVDELRQEHQRRLEAANAEIVAQRDMVRDADFKMRIMGNLPVARLIEQDDE